METMRITSTAPAKGAAPSQKSRATGDKSRTFSVQTAAVEAEATAGGVAGAGPVVAVDAVLALQGAPDATTNPSRGLGRGSELLKLLDQIRLGLLAGGIPRHTLNRLAGDLKAERAATADPRLSAILDEVELRARVELAKYEPSSG
jgi:hypothetical protein